MWSRFFIIAKCIEWKGGEIEWKHGDRIKGWRDKRGTRRGIRATRK